MTIAIHGSPQIPHEQLRQLAKTLSLPLYDRAGDFAYVLYQTSSSEEQTSNDRLELRSLLDPKIDPVFVDFLGGKSRHRRLHGGGKGQHLARALGLRKHPGCTVVDATAGLGRDAFILATLGCDVTMLERSAVIAALLRDGMQRARDSEDEAVQTILQRMQLLQHDAIHWLATHEDIADAVYLDPMHPLRKKSAQVKKEMRFFQHIVGRDSDAHQLLDLALHAARQRVVVKRPLRAETMTNEAPDFSIDGRSTRYDVYLIHAPVRLRVL
ncbi:MAG: class I SAM-dependent methyltransferase [Deltaproteobacteria bacterium]|nr:class I SAM-dependent methyltransferase [Deltaproteobacteria bacterium]